jgi:serine/threonine-protein kinase RsbW
MILRLELTSAVELVDLVQIVGGHVARDAGLDEESVHWVGLAIRESVINAIVHGNQHDANKLIFIEFDTSSAAKRRILTIRVRDQGEGFDPGVVANPLAPENLLKSSGRGIFLIRSFMDDVRLERMPEGGMQVLMTKHIPSSDTVED